MKSSGEATNVTVYSAHCDDSTLLQCVQKCCSEAFKSKGRGSHLPRSGIFSPLAVLLLISRAANVFGSHSMTPAPTCLLSLESSPPKSSHGSLLTVSLPRLKMSGDHAVTVRALELFFLSSWMFIFLPSLLPCLTSGFCICYPHGFSCL